MVCGVLAGASCFADALALLLASVAGLEAVFALGLAVGLLGRLRLLFLLLLFVAISLGFVEDFAAALSASGLDAVSGAFSVPKIAAASEAAWLLDFGCISDTKPSDDSEEVV